MGLEWCVTGWCVTCLKRFTKITEKSGHSRINMPNKAKHKIFANAFSDVSAARSKGLQKIHKNLKTSCDQAHISTCILLECKT